MSQENDTQQQGLSIDFGDELSKNVTIHKNVNQEIIITTADKIKLVLINTREVLTAQRQWWTPAGLLISFIATLCTAEFKDVLGMSKDYWQALFSFLSIGALIWLIVTLRKLYINRKGAKLDQIVEQIKLKEE